MSLYRPFTYLAFVGNLSVCGPLEHQREHFHLPVGERGKTRDMSLKRFGQKHGVSDSLFENPAISPYSSLMKGANCLSNDRGNVRNLDIPPYSRLDISNSIFIRRRTIQHMNNSGLR